MFVKLEVPKFYKIFQLVKNFYSKSYESLKMNFLLDFFCPWIQVLKEPYSLKVIIKHLDDTNTFVDKEYYPYSNGIGDIDNKKYEEAEQACLDKLIKIVKHDKGQVWFSGLARLHYQA